MKPPSGRQAPSLPGSFSFCQYAITGVIPISLGCIIVRWKDRSVSLEHLPFYCGSSSCGFLRFPCDFFFQMYGQDCSWNEFPLNVAHGVVLLKNQRLLEYPLWEMEGMIISHHLWKLHNSLLCSYHRIVKGRWFISIVESLTLPPSGGEGTALAHCPNESEWLARQVSASSDL